MAKQQRLPLGRLSAQQFAPIPEAVHAARDYTRSTLGTEYHSPRPQLQQSPQVGFAIQHEYRQHQSLPTAGHTRESYDAMRDDVNHQYAHMTRPREQGGMGLRHEVTEHDPYKTPQDMAHDVRHGRIQTLSTASTGHHNFFTDEENDKFRAVHDVFGHGATGRGFSRHGEEAAWRSHVQMFSPKAREAMTSETRGQNSYLNYSPGGGFPDQGSHLVGMSGLAQNPRAKSILNQRQQAGAQKTGPLQKERLPGV